MHSSITSFLAKAASATSLTLPKADEPNSSNPALPASNSQSNLLSQGGSRLSSLAFNAFKSPTPFSQEIRDTVQLFEASGSSPPKLVKAIEKLLRVLKRHPASPDLPLKHQVARKLFSCLQPQHPQSLHQLAIQAFSAIFERVGPERLMADIPMYLPNLLAFISAASVPSKLLALSLLEDFFLPLGTALCGCLTGFLTLLLPMMEFSSSSTTSLPTTTTSSSSSSPSSTTPLPLSSSSPSSTTPLPLSSSSPSSTTPLPISTSTAKPPAVPTPGLTPKLSEFLERLRAATGQEPFLVAVWQAAALGPSLHLPCLQYLRTQLLAPGQDSTSIMMMGLKALYYSLQDPRPAVFQEALSLLTTYCPLHRIMIGAEWVPLMIAIFSIFLQHDGQTRSDIIAWLLGTHCPSPDVADEISYFAQHTEHLFIQSVLELLKQPDSGSASPHSPSSTLLLLSLFVEAEETFARALFPRITPQLLLAIYAISVNRLPASSSEHLHLIHALALRKINLWSELRQLLSNLAEIDTAEARITSLLHHCLSLYNLYPVDLFSPLDFAPELILTLIRVLKSFIQKSYHFELLRNGFLFLSCCLSPTIWDNHSQHIPLLFPTILPFQELLQAFSPLLSEHPSTLQALEVACDGIARFIEFLSPTLSLPPITHSSPLRSRSLLDHENHSSDERTSSSPSRLSSSPSSSLSSHSSTESLSQPSFSEEYHQFLVFTHHFLRTFTPGQHPSSVQSLVAQILVRLSRLDDFLAVQPDSTLLCILSTCWQLLNSSDQLIHERVVDILASLPLSASPTLTTFLTTKMLSGSAKDRVFALRRFADLWKVAYCHPALRLTLRPSTLAALDCLRDDNPLVQNDASQWVVAAMRFSFHELLEPLFVETFAASARSFQNQYQSIPDIDRLRSTMHLLERLAGTDSYLFLFQTLAFLPLDWLLELNAKQLLLIPPPFDPKARQPASSPNAAALTVLAHSTYSQPLLWFMNNAGQSYAHFLVFLCLRFLSNRLCPALLQQRPELSEKNTLLQVAAANFLTSFLGSFGNPLLPLEKVALLKTLVEQSRWLILDLLENTLDIPSLHCALLLTLRSCFAIGTTALPEEPTQNPLVHVAMFTTKTINFPLLHLSQFESQLLLLVRKALQLTYASESIFPQWVAFLSYSHADLTQLSPSIMLWITELLSGDSNLFDILHSCLVLYFDFHFLTQSSENPKIISFSSSSSSTPTASSLLASPPSPRSGLQRETHPLPASCLLQLVPELISGLSQHIDSTQVSKKSKWDISHTSLVLAPLLQGYPVPSLFAMLPHLSSLPRMVFLILEETLSLPKLFQILLSALLQNHSRKSGPILELSVSDASILSFSHHFLSCAASLSASTWEATKSILRTGNAHASDPLVLTGLLQILWTFVRRVPPQAQTPDSAPDEPVQVYRKELYEILLALMANLVKYFQSFIQFLKTQRELLQIDSTHDELSEFNTATFENILQLIAQLEKSFGFLCYSIPPELKDQFAVLQNTSAVLTTLFVYSKRGVFPSPELKTNLRSAILRYFISLIQYPVLCRACRRQILDLLNSDVFFPLPPDLYQDTQRLISHILRKDDGIFLSLVRALPTSASLSSLTAPDDETLRSQGRTFKRLAFALLAGSSGQFEKHLPLLLETFAEGFNICYSSPYLLAPLFLCFRVLIVRFDASQIRSIWSLLFPELVRILTTINSANPLPAPLDSVSLLAAIKLIQMTTCLGIEEFCLHHWSFFQTHPLLSSQKYSPFFHQIRTSDYFSNEELALEHHQRQQNNALLAALHFGDPDHSSPIPSLEKLQSDFLTPELLQWISMGAQPASSKSISEKLLESEFIIPEELSSSPSSSI